MKAEVLESEKNLIKLKFEDIDQGLLNLAREELWQDKATEMAGFQITHPQVGHAVFTLKTKGKAPKATWNAAIDRISSQLDDLAKEVKKIK